MVYVQLSGDEVALEEYRPYITGPWSFHENTPPQLKQKLYDRVLLLLEDLESGKRKPAPPPSERLFRKMMEVAVGQPVPDEYVPLIKHEMGLAGAPPLEVTWRKRPADNVLKNFKVLIIGAGESGLCTGIKLQAMGIPFVIIEKNPTVGGTWYENRYPGCGVDTPNHFYCYSFEPNHDFSRHFSPRQELWQYLERCADRYDVRRHIRFNTEVTQAAWDERDSLWKIALHNGEELNANALVCAVGQLNRPHIRTSTAWTPSAARNSTPPSGTRR
jgi:4-hydroxyacetophenone monooxygenase